MCPNLRDPLRRIGRARLAAALGLAVAGAVCAVDLKANGAANPDAIAAPRSSIVFNCGDSGPGSLRYAIDHAASGDLIDLTQLTCSLITLTTGALHVPLDDLTLLGPGAGRLAIAPDPASPTSVLRHSGTGLLTISGLEIGNGTEQMHYTAGGCLYSAGSLRLVDDLVTGCTLTYPGAVVAGANTFATGDLSLENTLLLSGYLYGLFSLGAVAFVGGDLTMVGSMIAGGQAYGFGGYGGGALVYGNASISSSSINNNYAGSGAFGVGGYYAGYFGGLGLEGPASSAVIVNSTISSNHATTAIGGVFSAVSLTIANSTIACNTSIAPGSYYAAGLAVYATTADIESTIIANNTVAGNDFDLSGPPGSASGSNDLIMGSLIAPAGTLTSDPHLLPLAYNGGLTGSHLLQQDSPAIDAGNNNRALDYDQRGAPFPRVGGVRADIGATEYSDVLFGNGFDPASPFAPPQGLSAPATACDGLRSD
ncbi:MAG TPA: choice-of-anchor Q domain-containing protein [Rhodanobacteraceae bacterium]